MNDSADRAVARGLAPPRSQPFDPASVTRPDPRLMTYYTIVAAFTLIAFPITIIPLWIRYHTLRYRFDAEGVGMSVGILFKRETYLTYRRIQDIHVTRGLIQRWMGLATVEVQTAAGSATAEMTIEGVADPDGLRDWLYAKMRGVATHDASPAAATSDVRTDDEPLALLREIRDELRGLRERAATERAS
ncbi:MAG: PH domain-containing protein [Phycisphaerales bacterium]